jgi:tripartite-type tricarboxylate transporter receptor subunit TctC
VSEQLPISRRRRALLSAFCISCTYLFSAPAQAEAAYPHKPIRLIVPSAAGGSPDAICRLAATELGRALGQPIIVDNKPGAGGAIAMQELAGAAPDGYTLGYGNVGTLAINKSLYAKLPYDTEGYAGVAVLGSVQNALVLRNDLPIKSVKELITYAKANPGKLAMGSAGNGTTGHLGGELFKAMAGIDMTHVPYRGSPMAIQDLIGGQIDLMFDNLSSIGPHIKSGRVHALGVSGSHRSAMFPQLPTIQEAGVKGYETVAWGGIIGPKGMPEEIVKRLNAEINKLLALPGVREKYDQMAFEPMQSTPSLLMTMAAMEKPRWAEVIKRSGAKVD